MGRPKGLRLSQETKRKLSASQLRSWAKKKKKVAVP